MERFLKEKFLSSFVELLSAGLANQKLIPAGYPNISDVECTKEDYVLKPN